MLGLILIKFIEPTVPTIIFLATIGVSSFLPDIDNATSFIGKKAKPISMFLSHRQFFHSILCAITISLILFNLLGVSDYAFAFLIGYGSHLFLDSFNRGGIALFWPSPISLKGPFKCRGIFDMLFFIVFTAIDLYLIKKMFM
jgi:membrane-bound metal-dependent hydrolase YbcI (DUF457 family)